MTSAVARVVAAPAAAQTAGPVTSGVRVEGRVGWDKPEFKDKLVASDGSVLSRKSGKSGVSWGAEAGYDYVTNGKLLIGAYAGIAGSSAEDCPSAEFICRDFGRNITAGARVGYVLRRGVLYVKGGYSNGRVTETFDAPPPPPGPVPPPPPGPVPPPPPAFERISNNYGGFHVGAGGEVMIGRNAYTKLEYVYTDYGKDKDVPVVGGDATFERKRHQVLVGVGFRF